jgi:hypothetical protein
VMQVHPSGCDSSAGKRETRKILQRERQAYKRTNSFLTIEGRSEPRKINSRGHTKRSQEDAANQYEQLRLGHIKTLKSNLIP